MSDHSLSRIGFWEKLDRAIEEYRSTLALDPQLVAARLDLGAALNRLGRFQEAAEAYRQVVAVDTSSVRARRAVPSI
jgi:Flp pilus assembly protein TadD